MKLLRLYLFLVCLCGVLFHAVPSLGASNTLPVEDVVSMRTFLRGSTIALSPDGDWVAYTIDGAQQKQPVTAWLLSSASPPVQCPGCYVSVTSVRNGVTRRLTDGQSSSSWGAVWSPDGLRLAYYSDLSGRQQICIWERVAAQSHCFGKIETTGTGYTLTPQWTVGGDKILTKVVPVGKNILKSNTVASSANTPGTDRNEDRVTVTVYRNSVGSINTPQASARADSSSAGRAQSTLAFVDVTTGEIETLSQVQDPVWYSLSPNGAYIAFTVRKHGENPNSYQPVFDLLVLDLTSRRINIIASNAKTYGSSVSWSPNSTTLAFTTFDVASWPDMRGECFVASVDGQHLHSVTTGSHPSFASEDSPPLWDPSGTSIYLLPYYGGGQSRDFGIPMSADSIWMVIVSQNTAVELTRIPGRRILAVVAPRVNGRVLSVGQQGSLLLLTLNQGTKTAGYFKANVTTGVYTKVFENNKAYSYPIQSFNDASTDGKTVAFIAQQVNRTANIWAISNQESSPNQITNMNPQLDRVSYGSTSLVEWHSLDGEPLQGAVLLPPDYQKGKRYPVIVFQYPGSSFSDFINCYGSSPPNNDNMLLLSSRGYVVFLPDSISGPSTPMMDIAKSILPGVDKLIDLGIADPDRLGVMGLSYGGYGVLSLIVQTTRFKAAVAKAPGLVDRIAHYGNLWNDGSSIYVLINEGQLGGTIWDRRDKYIENSPIFYLDKVQTPLLIVQGTRDPATPELTSNELFVGLRRLGKEVEYAKYEGEGHAIQGYANQMDQLNRTIRWFDKYLKSSTTPVLSTTPKN